MLSMTFTIQWKEWKKQDLNAAEFERELIHPYEADQELWRKHDNYLCSNCDRKTLRNIMHATSLRPDVPNRQLTLNEHFLCFLVSYTIILYYINHRSNHRSNHPQ